MSGREVVVALRFRQFGDVLATVDALQAVKAKNPNRHIVYIIDAHFHPVLKATNGIDELWPSPPRASGPAGLTQYLRYIRRLRALHPSWVLDFHANPRSALLTTLAGAKHTAGYEARGRDWVYHHVEPRATFENGHVVPRTSAQSALMLARHVGIPDAWQPTMVRLPAAEITRADAAARVRATGIDFPDEPPIAVNPGRAYPAKMWPGERFVAVCQTLREQGLNVVVTWGPGERETAADIAVSAQVALAPQLSLEQLPLYMRACRGMLTIDSGLKHLAVAVGTPTVTLFGSTNPLEWHMGGPNDRVLWKGYSCSPCRRLDCPIGAPCMNDIAVADVLSSVEAMLAENNER